MESKFEVRCSGSVAPLVSVVNATDAREGDDLRVSRWALLNRPRLWTVLVEG